MLSLTHTIVSLPFGVYLQNPALIFTTAFLFHLLTDSLLHWNIYPKQYPHFPYKLVTLDVISGLIAAWLLLGNNIFTPAIVAAITGGNAPDVLHSLWLLRSKTNPPPLWLTWVKPFFTFHHKIQRETDNVIRGLVFQIILAALALTLILSR